MKETQRINKLFRDIYDGHPWIDVTILGTLKTLSGEKASKKISPHWNTIWEIVNHLISWRLNVLQRLQGKVLITPDTNYFVPVSDTSETAWQQTLSRLEESQKQWEMFLNDFLDDNFSKKYSVNSFSYYEHIHGVLQHDAYHLGQIILLSKAL